METVMEDGGKQAAKTRVDEEIERLRAAAEAAAESAFEARMTAAAGSALAQEHIATAVERLAKAFSSYAIVNGALYDQLRAIGIRENRIEAQLEKLNRRRDCVCRGLIGYAQGGPAGLDG